jgi:hypothetical protein
MKEIAFVSLILLGIALIVSIILWLAKEEKFSTVLITFCAFIWCLNYYNAIR